MNSMKTLRLFRDDVYMKEATSLVTDCQESQGKALVTLDETIFFPTGGGQSCDKGTIENVAVLDVYEQDGQIYHLLDCPYDKFKSGDKVSLVLDWDHRFDNMQRHCGEHILSGIFFREFGGVNRGFHMGDSYMTVDISLEENPDIKEITWDMAKHAELEANKVIWQNMPVITRHFDSAEEAKDLPLRKALAIDEDVSIVCVGGVENPADCVACCGTHPSTAGQVGLIKIYKVEANKGMFRIYFEAGKRALLKYQKEFDTITKLGNMLSAGTEDLLEKYHSQEKKNHDIRSQLHFIKKEVLRRETRDLIEVMELHKGTQLPYREYELLSVDDLATLGKDLEAHIPKLLFLIHKPSCTLFLCSSGKIDCGQLVKDNASIYSAKGGGTKTLARAIFPDQDNIPIFMDLIEKHLRA